MTGSGWADGSDIRSRGYVTPEARDEYDRIFKHGRYGRHVFIETLPDKVCLKCGGLASDKIHNPF